MSSYGELIQALKVLKNVKEKRHGIKTLSSLCANRAFQVRIVQRGGWRDAILPLIISLDEDCRKYAALAIANLSTSTATHQQLLEEEVLRHLVPILVSEEVQEVVVYVLNALGNFAISSTMWAGLQQMNTIKNVAAFVDQADREEILLNAMFCMANLTGDPFQRAWMMSQKTYKKVWQHMTENRNIHIMQYALAILRGLAVEPEAEEVFPKLGLVPHLVGIFTSAQATNVLKTLVLDILLHLSFRHSNAALLLQPSVMAVIEQAARGATTAEYVPVGVAIIANLCENVEHHDELIESPLFEIVTNLILNDKTEIQFHVIRAMMHLALSPKYHHVILATGVMANVCPVAGTDRLSVEMRANALQMMAAVCATHPTTPTEGDVMDLLFLICSSKENLEIRRAAMLVIANASADKGNAGILLNKKYIESLVITLSRSTDGVLTDYLMQFFHNICKLDNKAGSMMLRCGYEKHMFTYERLESLSITSAIYLCDTCRQLVEDAVVRNQLMQEMIIKSMLDAWVVYIEDPQIAPHLALMASALAYHADTHEEFVLQGGVRLVIELYSRSDIEHVRLCCVLSLLYLAETPHARRSMVQERGIMMLLTAAENETHIDLVMNSLKALIQFASSDDYRPELGQEGAIDTFAAFLFSDQLSLQQLGIYLLQMMLELRANRRILLGLAEEKKCEEDYLEPMVKFLPRALKGAPRRLLRMTKEKKGKDNDSNLSPHDPFIVRCVIHAISLLSLEHSEDILQRFINLQLPSKLFDLFYSESVDRSSGEAILLFFANTLHSRSAMQSQVMKGIDVIPLLLAARDMGFSQHTNTRCLSALLSLARVPDFRRMVMGQLELIMASVNANLSGNQRDEDFYCTTAVHCALLCELARASTEFHERMAKAGVVEAFLVFITLAGKGVNGEMSVELLMSAVFGIAALVSSPITGEQCMASLLFPATRLQLCMSLLRLPSLDVNSTFYAGTIGVRTLQRTVAPDITPEELQVDGMDVASFIDRCGVKPAAFLYRNIIRTLCLLLAHHEMAERVQQAIAPPRIVPTCLFALRDAEDVYVNVYGYLLVANFSKHAQLQPGFVNDSSIVNEILTGCRRGSSASGEETEEQRVVMQLDSISKDGAAWSAKSVALNKYLLAMIALTNLAENVKEVYRTQEDTLQTGEAGAQMADDPTKQLTLSNRMFMRKFAAVCLHDLDTAAILSSHKMTEVQEFSALLKVIALHNTFVARIQLESYKKGGEVQVLQVAEATGAAEVPRGSELVPKELRVLFKTLGHLQSKCEGLLDVVEQCLDTNTGRTLIGAIVECLCGLTYLSPLCILDPYSMYRIIKRAPEWMHNGLTCLLCNALADEARIEKSAAADSGEMLNAESDYLFPLISTSTRKTKQYMLGALANLGPRHKFIDFIVGSGVFRVIKPLLNRSEFVENFGLILECIRLLSNMTCMIQTHQQVMTENVVGFLRDVLRYSGKQVLYDLQNEAQHGVAYKKITATFEEDDMPPLGFVIRWEVPPYITEVKPGTPAALLLEPLLNGDELVEVNGTDISEKEQSEVEALMDTRPLQLAFRRTLDHAETSTSTNLEEEPITRVDRLDTYGDPKQYLECFNLALITIHNLATNNKNHPRLLEEPKILDMLLDIVPSEVLSPSLRRITFSILTCLAQQKEISGRIFQDMTEYFRSCERGDPALQKFIMLCANLFYTSMKPEEVVPNTGTLMFIGRLAELEMAAASNVALVEVLHGMSRAPRERRKDFVCRETMVLVVKFLEDRDQWDAQLRAFEAAYFLTLGACDPKLWATLELVPRMVRAAGKVREFAGRDPGLQKQADGLFELSIRSAELCLAHEELVVQLALPDLDRYLMDILAHPSKPATLVECAAHLMTGLLKSKIGHSCWIRWRSMGVGDKVVVWFRNHKARICGGDDDESSSGSVSIGQCMDAIFHFLIHAVEMDADLVSTFIADDVVSCIAHRILRHVRFYRTNLGTAKSDLSAVNVSFRSMAQLLTALARNEHGLAMMGKVGLAIPLASLLHLPADDFRIPALILLCCLCGHKESCEALIRSSTFIDLLKGMESKLAQPSSNFLPEELEYFVCILDRSCCYPDLAAIVQKNLMALFFLLPAKSKTMDAQVAALRALTRCTFANPDCLDTLPQQGLACMHYMMAATSCIRNASVQDPDSPASISRRDMIAGMTETFAQHPHGARLVVHFSRAILCESTSVSRSVCQSMFPDLDCLSMLHSMTVAFEHAYEKAGKDFDELDLMAADVLNNLVGMLHVMLCVIFRQKKPGQGEGSAAQAMPADYIAKTLGRVFEALHRYLRFSSVGNPQDDAQAPVAAGIARMLVDDIRVLFFITALLREICAAPVHSIFINVIRTEGFFQALQCSIHIATTRLNREKSGKPPRNLFAGRQAGGARESPIAGHLDDFDLALIFEHLLVCLRHSLVQAMFVPPPADELPTQPWLWKIQERHAMHSEAFAWIPDVLTRYHSTQAIKMEVVRYICAAANFYTAPQAALQAADEGGASPEAPFLVTRTFSLLQPHILGILTQILETSNDACTLSLACLAASNLAGYEQRCRLQAESQRHLPIEELQRLVLAIVRVLKCIPKLPREMGANSLTYTYRTLSNFLAFASLPLTCTVMETGALEAVRMTFDFFFRDVFKLDSTRSYTDILQNLILLVRNWSTGGCSAELELERIYAKGIPPTIVDVGHATRILAQGMDVPNLLNLLLKLTFKLTDVERKIPEVNDALLDAVYEDVVVTVRTLFKRTEAKKSMNWQQLEQQDFEKLMEDIKEHRYKRSGIFEDEDIINILYLMTKQGFSFRRAYFPDFMMQVAYGGHREQHSLMQDIAAVCCAIITTQNAKDRSGPSCNIATVVKDHAKFLHSLEQVPDSRMQLWHYRLLTQWSQRPRVLDEVSADARALQFIADKLLDPILGRYSIVILHNISVLRHLPLLRAGGHLATACEAYKRLSPGGTGRGDEAERRLLRRLLMASMRNCLYSSTDLDNQLSEVDLVAIVELCDVVEAGDTPLYVATMLHLCQMLNPERVVRVLPGHAPLVHLLTRCMVEQAWRNSSAGLNDSDLYSLMTPEAIALCIVQVDPELATNTPKGASTPVRGLGKKMSLYQQNRMKRQPETTSRAAPQPGAKPAKSSAAQQDQEQEYLYYATAEVLTHTTFREVSPEALAATVAFNPLPETPEVQGEQGVRDALQAAFVAYPASSFLSALQKQVSLYERRKTILTDLFVQVSAKFIWHSWSNPMFRPYFNTVPNLQAVADLTAFFLDWPNEDVQHLISEVVLYAGIHKYPVVTEYLVENQRKYPELAGAVLTKALVDEEVFLTAVQGIRFIQTFVELLRGRALTRTGLHRLAIGLQRGLLADHPKGICAYLLQRESALLGDLLEQLYTYSESGTVKQSMVVVLAQTAGVHYKAIPELDEFVLRMLDLASPLLESEFELFFPVLHRLALQGGKRVRAPLLARQLHMRVARILEDNMVLIEAAGRKREVWEAEVEETQPQIARLSARQKVQWILAFFTALAGATTTPQATAVSGKASAHAQDPHFDAFVCVDLLPLLVRILRKDAQTVEALAVSFLLSSVATSPCIVPHMPDVLRLAEGAYPAIIEPDGPAKKRAVAAAATLSTSGLGAGAALGRWQHLRPPRAELAEAAMRRSLVHLLANAGFMPPQNPALLAAPKVLQFLARLEIDTDMFENPAAPLHTQIYCLAQLCARADQQNKAIDMELLEMLKKAAGQIEDDAGMTDQVSADVPDLRLPFIHCMVSLAGPSGPTLLQQQARLGVELLMSAMRLAEDILQDSSRLRGGVKGLHLALECQQALAAAIGRLSLRLDFMPLRAEYSIFLLALACSAPLLSLRTAACEHLINVLTQGYEPQTTGAIFLKTPCLLSFRLMVRGPLDELAVSCTKVMQALAQHGGYDCHVHMLPNLEGIMDALGNPTSSATRCLQLAELFVALTKERTFEVLDAIIELPNITAFLGLARSSQASRRELVLKWLEAFGSSLYEIDEVNEVFGASTLRGLLHLAARSALNPQDAQNFRRVMFSLVKKRIDSWRASLFGVKDFLSEVLITALLPMCEKQPDLVASTAALFHSCITRKEMVILERLWHGGHFVWLCQRMVHKSRAQLYAESAATGKEPMKAAVSKAWEKHVDLTAAQGMFLRVIWCLYDMFPNELSVKLVDSECLMKNWTDYVPYYCHYAWPLRETQEVERATDAALVLAMQLFARVAADVSKDLQQKLVQQGAMGLCATVLLPSPKEQERLRSAICLPDDAEPEETDTSETRVLSEAKMIAAAVATWLLQHPEAYRWFSQRRVMHYAIGMFSQLHHWRTAVMEQQGSLSVLATVGLLERFATFYMAVLSSLTVEWCLENVGLAQMGALLPVFLEMWSRHANAVVKHHALRIFSNYCQVHVLYVSILSSEPQAEVLASAMHRTFGSWEVRDLRHIIRLLVAALAHALVIPVMPEHVSTTVVQALRQKSDCAALLALLQEGGALRADSAASRHLLLAKFLSQVLGWCEQPGDTYGRVWALWLVLTFLAYEDPDQSKDPQDLPVLILPQYTDEKHLQRRARLKKEQTAVLERAGEEVDPLGQPGTTSTPRRTRCGWLRNSPVLCTALAHMAGKSLAVQWKLAQQLACVTSARCFFELPQFQQTSVETLRGEAVVRVMKLPDKAINLAALLLTVVLSSFRLPLTAQTVAAEFLKKFYDLAATVIEGLASCGEGPYDLVARWICASPGSLPCDAAYRGLVAFMIGQCACPPLATVPSLELDGRGAERNAPPVAECDRPPVALLDKLAFEAIKEEQRLKQSQVNGKGPLYSAILCHLLYALAVLVPMHPKAAANSASVRGAAFAQLMKVQSMVAVSVQPASLYDPADGARDKLFLYIKATACIRAALQCVTGSWLAADFGARFAITEEGGRDFMQYCTKHLQQVYNNKTALTRVLGTPWERVMLSQGPTSTIAELVLIVCSTDANLREVNKFGGEMALHALSRFGEDAKIRQQATMLLTKLAVMQHV